MNYFTTKKLIERNWTISMIKKFLVVDKTKINQFYKSSPPMKLFSEEQVINIEKSNKFNDYLNKSIKRRKSSKKAIKTKENKLIDYINNIEINIKLIDDDIKLKKKAINSYNNFKRDISIKNDYLFETINLKSDKFFLDRIVVNFIRHNLTEYDEKIEEIFGKTGKEKAYNILREKIFNKIMVLYPKYKSECERQLFGDY